jgi:predicted NACHT family NTPase
LCHAGDNYYAFVHRTFLEYFCAEAFRIQFEKEKSLTLEQLKTEVYGKHWQDEAWDEVLKLIAGAIDVKFVGEIIEYLMDIDGEEEKFRNVFLAAGCLREVRERKSGDIYALDRRLLGIVKGLVSYGFYKEQRLFDYNEYIEADNKNIREIRTQAVMTIASVWNDDPDTLIWLKQLVQSDDDWRVQSAAVRELARNFKDDEETLPWLKKIAQTDNDFPIRLTAVEELIHNFKDGKDVLTTLKQRAQTDNDDSVRIRSLEGLAEGCKNEVGMFQFFCDIAVNDSFRHSDNILTAMFEAKPRQTALEILHKYYPNHPQTRSLLQDKAENDPDEQLREWAKKIIDSNCD